MKPGPVGLRDNKKSRKTLEMEPIESRLGKAISLKPELHIKIHFVQVFTPWNAPSLREKVTSSLSHFFILEKMNLLRVLRAKRLILLLKFSEGQGVTG